MSDEYLRIISPSKTNTNKHTPPAKHHPLSYPAWPAVNYQSGRHPR